MIYFVTCVDERKVSSPHVHNHVVADMVQRIMSRKSLSWGDP